MNKAFEELLTVAESIVDGWYPEGTRMDWEDLLFRLEVMAEVDLPEDMLHPEIIAIQKHIRAYRKL